MSNREQLISLYKKYELTPEHVFKHKHYTIITRQGIDKIQALAKIDITYETISLDREFAVIKAIGLLDNRRVESYGEADRKTNCKNEYHIAMAEKRAMSRVVLKLTGFDAIDGVYGQDESEDFKKNQS